MRASIVLLLLAACDGSTKPPVSDDTGDTFIGVDDDTSTGPQEYPELTLSSESIDFGTIAPGDSTTQILTVSNDGVAPLLVTTSMSSGGDNFSVDDNDFTVAPGASANLTLTFTGDTVGGYAGSLHLTTDDPDEGSVDVALTGTIADDTDGDDDGYDADSDCDDTDPTVNPGATETWYDGIDQDCDGANDYDQDGDGSVYGEDCDDTNPEAYPGNEETWYDGLDADCSGGSDYDQDGDNWDSSAYGGEDCDDLDAAANPGTDEVADDGIDNDCDGTVDEALSEIDTDGDGYTEATGDCDETDATINPSAEEIWYDGIDQDCDGNDTDQDGDGWTLAYDCDDTDASAYPGATEVWYDGVDEDCDGLSDYDQDFDGYDSADYGGVDCDDLTFEINPAAVDTWYDGIDSDCSGTSDYDADGDGFDSVDYGGDDCDDTDATVNPDATEVWYDGVDQDCSATSDYDQDLDGEDSDAYGGVDCDDLDATVNTSASDAWYDGVDSNCDGASDYDRDGDGQDSDDYGGEDCNDLDATVYVGATETWYDGIDQDCSGGSDYDQDADGYTSADYGGLDCDDTDATVNPGATELYYDGIDQDCDGASDYDADGDGYDDTGFGGTDCDDTVATVHPGATETCDGVDNDCDGTVDDGVTTTYYADTDGDGYGDLATTTTACSAPSGYVTNSTDCDDTASTINPRATEVCDSIDNDCDGATDEGLTYTTYYADTDGDLYGDSTTSISACAATSGYVTNRTDCDDTDSGVHPGATETCNSVDDDCDGSTDEGVTTTYYRDTDADGYGVSTSTTASCSLPSGYSTVSTDCNDSSASIYPGAVETCNSIDDDCDGTVDDGTTSTTWYRDADSDGYGTTATTTTSCASVSGYVTNSTDCNDSSSAVNPAATETCNSIDDDCDTSIDEGVTTTYYRDVDGDGYGTTSPTASSCSLPSGYSTVSTDCDDAVAAVNPGETEVCNSIDDDCDGSIDEGMSGSTTYYADSDGDGFGDATSSTTGCSAPSGYVSDATDCNDADATAYPGAAEISYDVSDNDCDGYQDDMIAIDETDWTILGDDESDAIGSAGVWVTDDLDGDGDPELVVGVPGWDYTYTWWWTTYTDTDLGVTAFHDVDDAGLDVSVTDGYYGMYGNGEDDAMGQAFGVLGDLDGDGYDEVAFAAIYNNGNETDDGTVYIYDVGGESGTDTASWWYSEGAILGDSDNGWLGYSMAVGDFDADGVSDLAMGAPGEQSGRGRVYVCFEDNNSFGSDVIDDTDCSFYATGVSSSDHLGYSVAFGDFDGDGDDDLAMCGPDDDDNGSGSGTCWVVNGATTRDTSTVHGTTVSSLYTAKITGSAASDQAGLAPQSLAAGDISGDGRDDLIVGVPGYDGASTNGGGVWIYNGGSLSGSETVSTANYLIRGDGALGTAVNVEGDVTGDGTLDLLIGATTAASSAGRVYLFEGGQSTGTYTLPDDQYASWDGENSGDLFGTAIGGLFDLDGDGTDDFAVSAPGNDDVASGAGKVYVLPAY